MNKILLQAFFLLSVGEICSFNRYGTQLIKDIAIPGYKPFNYVIWKHPLQVNGPVSALFNKELLDNACSFIVKGGVVIDIGAHTGDTSVLYAIVVGEKGRVIAFEPNPACFEVLKQNARWHPIIPIKKAIMDHMGVFTFNYTDPGLCNGGCGEVLSSGSTFLGAATIKVDGVRLYDWLLSKHSELIKKICFIKIDTEGYDRVILRDIAKLVRRVKPVIQFEFFPYLNADERADLFQAITQLGYRCFWGGITSRKRQDLTVAISHDEFVSHKGLADVIAILS